MDVGCFFQPLLFTRSSNTASKLRHLDDSQLLGFRLQNKRKPEWCQLGNKYYTKQYKITCLNYWKGFSLRGKSVELLYLWSCVSKNFVLLMYDLKSNKDPTGYKTKPSTWRVIAVLNLGLAGLHSVSLPGDPSKQVLLEHFQATLLPTCLRCCNMLLLWTLHREYFSCKNHNVLLSSEFMPPQQHIVANVFVKMHVGAAARSHPSVLVSSSLTVFPSGKWGNVKWSLVGLETELASWPSLMETHPHDIFPSLPVSPTYIPSWTWAGVSYASLLCCSWLAAANHLGRLELTPSPTSYCCPLVACIAQDRTFKF